MTSGIPASALTEPEAVAELGTVLTKPYAPEALIAATSNTRRTGLFARLKGAISHD